jgi:hypothetical protein
MFSIRNVAMAITLGICGTIGSTAVHAQATTGTLFGWAPPGDTVTVHSTNGIHRHAAVDAQGRYSIHTLPYGSYVVTLEKDGQAIEKHPNVNLLAGRGQEVDFVCRGAKCAEAANN